MLKTTHKNRALSNSNEKVTITYFSNVVTWIQQGYGKILDSHNNFLLQIFYDRQIDYRSVSIISL